MNKNSTIFSLGILMLLAVMTYAGFLYWQKGDFAKRQDLNNARLVDLNSENGQLESEKLLSALTAKEKLGDLEAKRVIWSRIIRDIDRALPKDDGDDVVNVLSYSASVGNSISLSFKTLAGREAPYLDVASLIQAFDESPDFYDNFVPGISQGVNDQGEEILSFSMTTSYDSKASSAQADNEEASSPTEKLTR